MRIIAGKWKGRVLAAPTGEKTRPILDRVKVTLFDWLGSRLAEPGHLPPIAVLDLFAGAGTLAFESLSRGAAHACLIEKRSAALAAIRANVEALHAEADCTIVRGDVLTAPLPPPPGEHRYELIFFDPPYAMTQTPTPGDKITTRIEQLAGDPTVADDALLIVRQDRTASALPPIAAWPSIETRSVGSMTLTLLRRTTPD
jgi:16S rRNA (guanine966-N2)-methyltransferase